MYQKETISPMGTFCLGFGCLVGFFVCLFGFFFCLVGWFVWRCVCFGVGWVGFFLFGLVNEKTLQT